VRELHALVAIKPPQGGPSGHAGLAIRGHAVLVINELTQVIRGHAGDVMNKILQVAALICETATGSA
jgi:hypothetical protein